MAILYRSALGKTFKREVEYFRISETHPEDVAWGLGETQGPESGTGRFKS